MAWMLNVYALPSLVTDQDLADGTAVVVDVLRATTTITYALAAGAREVIACTEIEEARRIASQLPAGEVLLGGEREGRPIEGFDLGNSPGEYIPERVAGRTIVFTTSHGTRALAQVRAARQILLGAFVNAQALCDRLAGVESIHIVCAGTRGQISRDDVLAAGLLVERLQRASADAYTLNAQAITARENWRYSFAIPFAVDAEPIPPERLAAELRQTLAGQHLIGFGYEEDIVAAAQLDRFACVPCMDPSTMRITASAD
ncbi:MAG: 2-phosphosulfolactate phosphatase [Thermoguttaceae bacterium]|nr:2-phosphosulfolactate phosphatase [Thermoguttaceae bacterium]MDW8036487.1 2-phosphosulfolactate phosphatase [Thermoguttaceae bacterium]